MRSALSCLALFLTSSLFAQSTSPISSGNIAFGQQQPSSEQILDDVALVVNDRALSRRELNAQLQRELAMLPKEASLTEEQRQAQALENLIMWHILEQLAVRLEVGASHEEIARAEQSIAQNNGLSVAALHQKVLKETGLNQSAFQFQVARGILEDKLKYGLMAEEVKVSEGQIDDQLAQLARHQGSFLHVQDILLPMPEGDAFQRAPKMREILQQVSDALEQFPNNPRQAAAQIPNAQFNDLGRVNLAQIPNRFAKVLINLPIGEITPSPVVDADGLHFLRVVDREDQDGNYRIPEYLTSHILIRHTPHNDAIAQAKMQAVQSALNSGQDFQTVARRFSEDTVSAARGGSLGWVSAPTLLPEFANMMTKLAPNTLSPVVRTDVGYHILWVHENRSANRNEQMMREEVRQFLFEKAVAEAWADYISQLRTNAYVKTY